MLTLKEFVSKNRIKNKGELKQRFRSFFKRKPLLSVALIVCILSTIYWLFIASDRYVSESHVLVQRTDSTFTQSTSLSSLISNVGGSNQSDQLILRDYLLSPDMLAILDKKLNLRAHFSNWKKDPFSRMMFKDAPMEMFYQYYLSRVHVEYDDYTGLLDISAEAFDPEMAFAITQTLIAEGEKKMNRISHILADEQVEFVQQQVNEAAEKFHAARQMVIAYQNQNNIASPTDMAKSVTGVIDSLDAQRAELQAKKSTLLGYLTPDAPNVVELDYQIDAINKQIQQEQKRLTTSTGNEKTLNTKVEEYQRLELQAGFAEDVYKTALAALEKGRVEATREIKKVSVIQDPTLPQYSMAPSRLYNIVVFILVTFLAMGILHLIIAIVKDHKD